MLATSVRERPCSERLRRSSSGRDTCSVPSSPLPISIGSAMVCDRVPLGPLTVTARPSMFTSTPAGTGMGRRPILDMLFLLPSPDVGEDFPAHALLGGLPVGEQPRRRGDDGDAEPPEDLWQVGGLCVDAKSRLRDA